MTEQGRKSYRRRSGALMALIVGPIVLLVAVVKVFEPHHYPSGDVRNEPLFWIGLAVAALLLTAILVVGSIRTLRRGSRRDPP